MGQNMNRKNPSSNVQLSIFQFIRQGLFSRPVVPAVAFRCNYDYIMSILL